MPTGDADGATPLDPDELDGLIPAGILSRADLNAWEQSGIRTARSWVLDRRRPVPADRLLTERFLRELHRRMFGNTWRWAGHYRQSDTNIGVHWPTIPVAMHDALADTTAWLTYETWPRRELLARSHHRMVTIHPFPNGNGRWSRLATDTLARTLDIPMPTWGAETHADPRAAYLTALRAADEGEVAMLTAFMWA